MGKILIQILNPKTDFLFLCENPKKDYESIESIRDEVQKTDFLFKKIRIPINIRIRILGIHDFCVSLGKGSKKVQLAV